MVSGSLDGGNTSIGEVEVTSVSARRRGLPFRSASGTARESAIKSVGTAGLLVVGVITDTKWVVIDNRTHYLAHLFLDVSIIVN